MICYIIFQQNALPPVSQTLPATTQAQQPQAAASAPAEAATASASPEKPQSNGTTEAKSPVKADAPPGNHVTPPKEKTPAPPQVPQVVFH